MVTLSDLEQENAALRARVSELEQRLAEQEQAGAAQARSLDRATAELGERARILDATLNSITDGVVVCDANGTLTHMNPAAVRIQGVQKMDSATDEWSKDYGFFKQDGATRLPAEEVPLFRALRGEIVDGAELFVRNPGRPEGLWMRANAGPIRAEDGAMLGAVTVFQDITEERRRVEREREQQRAIEQERSEMVQRLRAAVHELSTPILEVWDDVLVLPVIGVVDTQRSAEMMDRLLEAVEHKQCRFVIIDITGVEVVDSSTAHQFIKLVTAVEYLGARCVLTGTRGAVAQTLVSLGMDLGPLTMLRNLKHGLRECMRRMEAEDARGGGKATVAAAGRRG